MKPGRARALERREKERERERAEVLGMQGPGRTISNWWPTSLHKEYLKGTAPPASQLVHKLACPHKGTVPCCAGRGLRSPQNAVSGGFQRLSEEQYLWLPRRRSVALLVAASRMLHIGVYNIDTGYAKLKLDDLPKTLQHARLVEGEFQLQRLAPPGFHLCLHGV